ncbi:NYN domain-containing protein [Brevibacillus nitrificans]|uniref:NYN domain-containing protein n=2 Tax=Brevibacillus nitrificans TaxID=651560 RepID=A0A3M8D5I7_9BACL|nr:NYN domain-containing protein [Brevibacillus nitrificans]
MYDNVAIFVDYDNIYWTLSKGYMHDPDCEDPSKNLFEKLTSTYNRDNIRVFKSYADYEQIKSNLTSLQKKRIQIRHVYANGKKEQGRKNSSDIELCLDAIELCNENPNISCFVFVTADSDMIPIMSRLMYKGKRVELYSISSATSKQFDMNRYAHEHVDLLDFLGIETKEYDLDTLIEPALRAIKGWTDKYETDKSRFLGDPVLKELFQNELSIPQDIGSQLIERLVVEKLIEKQSKEFFHRNLNQTSKKPSNKLTTKGLEKISTVSDVAIAEVKSGASQAASAKE